MGTRGRQGGALVDGHLREVSDARQKASAKIAPGGLQCKKAGRVGSHMSGLSLSRKPPKAPTEGFLVQVS